MLPCTGIWIISIRKYMSVLYTPYLEVNKRQNWRHRAGDEYGVASASSSYVFPHSSLAPNWPIFPDLLALNPGGGGLGWMTQGISRRCFWPGWSTRGKQTRERSFYPSNPPLASNGTRTVEREAFQGQPPRDSCLSQRRRGCQGAPIVGAHLRFHTGEYWHAPLPVVCSWLVSRLTTEPT